MPAKKTSGETSSAILRKAMLRRLPRRTKATGQIVWPAVPSLMDHYTRCLTSIFASLGRKFSAEETAVLRENLKKHIVPAFQVSPHSRVVVDYHTEPPPNTALTYSVSHRVITMVDEYAEWVRSRTPPLFGPYPDAKVMQLAWSLGNPTEVAVLDVGAGTGRNTLPLARAGFAVDAVEIAPSLAAVLRDEIERELLHVSVIEGDALDPKLEIPACHYRLVILAEVVASHCRGTAQLRSLLKKSFEWLAPGGLLLFNAFLSSGGYEPTTAAREMSQVMWCSMFTRRELDEAARELPLTLVSDESTHDFEHKHLEASAWPPTGWFSEWTRGQNLFDLPADETPFELRWLVYRRQG
jgi:SAM-dependent methyltransferase